MKQTPKRVGAAVVAAAVAATVGLSPLRSAAADTAASPDVLGAVADSIYAAGGSQGFSGQVLDEAAGSIQLYWQGNVPTSVSRILGSLPSGVSVQVSPGQAYSRLSEQAASSSLINSSIAQQIGVAKIQANDEGTGITVFVTGAAPDLAQQALVAAQAGLPQSAISYTPNTEAGTNIASRNADAAPWHSGARYHVGTQGCTTGFSVLKGGYGYLLSANHCDTGSGAVVVGDFGTTTIAPGTAVSHNTSIDSLLIDPTASPATTPHVYTGAWNSTTTATVLNYASNWKGQTVCGSGASTGEHCGTITNDALALPGLSGSWYIEAKAPTGAISGKGDSGGPVFVHITGGVQARGIMIQALGAATCPTKDPSSENSCYTTVDYVPISVELNTWGASLEVG